MGRQPVPRWEIVTWPLLVNSCPALPFSQGLSSLMQLTVHCTPLPDVQADWLIAGVWENEGPGGTIEGLDARLGNLLARLRQKEDITGKALELTPLLDPKGIAADRLMVVGLGKRNKVDRAALTDAAAAAARAVTGKKCAGIAFALPEGAPELSWNDVAQAAGVGLMQGCY